MTNMQKQETTLDVTAMMALAAHNPVQLEKEFRQEIQRLISTAPSKECADKLKVIQHEMDEIRLSEATSAQRLARMKPLMMASLMELNKKLRELQELRKVVR